MHGLTNVAGADLTTFLKNSTTYDLGDAAMAAAPSPFASPSAGPVCGLDTTSPDQDFSGPRLFDSDTASFDDDEMGTPGLSSPASEEDAAMEMEKEDPQTELAEVLLLGSDGSQLRCLKGEIREYSTKLHTMITDFDGMTSQLVLDLRHDEIRILVDMMTAPRRPSNASFDYFKYYNLDLLLRGIELFTLYDFHWWDVSIVEEAILERLDPASDQHEAETCFSLANAVFASKIRTIAQGYGMSQLQELVDREAPLQIEVEGERPRKWRKVSDK